MLGLGEGVAPSGVSLFVLGITIGKGEGGGWPGRGPVFQDVSCIQVGGDEGRGFLKCGVLVCGFRWLGPA